MRKVKINSSNMWGIYVYLVGRRCLDDSPNPIHKEKEISKNNNKVIFDFFSLFSRIYISNRIILEIKLTIKNRTCKNRKHLKRMSEIKTLKKEPITYRILMSIGYAGGILLCSYFGVNILVRFVEALTGVNIR